MQIAECSAVSMSACITSGVAWNRFHATLAACISDLWIRHLYLGVDMTLARRAYVLAAVCRLTTMCCRRACIRGMRCPEPHVLQLRVQVLNPSVGHCSTMPLSRAVWPGACPAPARACLCMYVTVFHRALQLVNAYRKQTTVPTDPEIDKLGQAWMFLTGNIWQVLTMEIDVAET